MIRQASSAADRGRPPVELGGVAARARRRDLVHRQRAVDASPSMMTTCSRSGRLGADLIDLGDLGGVLADDHLGARVADDPLALVRRVRRVHGHDDRPGRRLAARSASVNSRRVLARMATRSPTPTPSSIKPEGEVAHPVPQLVVASAGATRRRAGSAPRWRRRSARRRAWPAWPSSARWVGAGSVVTASR